MARSFRGFPDVYFGAPGALMLLPWPRNGMDKPYEVANSDFVTGSGMHRMTRMAGGSRLRQLNWRMLGLDTYNRISEFWIGANGNGPFCLIDPSEPNLLTPNQAAAGGVWNDARGFTPGAPTQQGAAFANADATHIHRVRSRRSIKWALTGTMATTPILVLDAAYKNWFGVPCVVGLPYTLSLWVKSTGDTSITATVRMSWRNTVNTQLSESATGSITINGTYTQYSITGTAPANAAYVSPRLSITGSSVTTPADIYLDDLMLEQDTVVNTWAPGTGVNPVGILGLSDTVPIDARFRESPTLALREVVG